MNPAASSKPVYYVLKFHSILSYIRIITSIIVIDKHAAHCSLLWYPQRGHKKTVLWKVPILVKEWEENKRSVPDNYIAL